MEDRFARRTSKRLAQALIAGVMFVGLTAASIGGYWGAVQYQGNFHTVEQGAFYRSAQLSKAELQTAIREHRIKAILNLRGAHPGEPIAHETVNRERTTPARSGAAFGMIRAWLPANPGSSGMCRKCGACASSKRPSSA